MGYDKADLWLCLGHWRPPVCLYNYGKLLHLREWRTSLLFIWAKLFFNKCLSWTYVRMRNSKESRAKTKRHSHEMRMRVHMRTYLLHKCNFLPNVSSILSFCPHTIIRALSSSIFRHQNRLCSCYWLHSSHTRQQRRHSTYAIFHHIHQNHVQPYIFVKMRHLPSSKRGVARMHWLALSGRVTGGYVACVSLPGRTSKP